MPTVEIYMKLPTEFEDIYGKPAVRRVDLETENAEACKEVLDAFFQNMDNLLAGKSTDNN